MLKSSCVSSGFEFIIQENSNKQKCKKNTVTYYQKNPVGPNNIQKKSSSFLEKKTPI